MDIQQQWAAIRRRWYLPVGMAVLFALIAAITAPSAPAETVLPEVQAARGQVFDATHTLYRTPSGRDLNLAVVQLLATRGDIPANVATAMGSDLEPQILVSRATVTADDQLGTIEVTVRDEDPTFAQQLANTYAQEILNALTGDVTEGQAARLAALDAQAAQIQQRVEELQAQIATSPEGSAERLLLESDRAAVLEQYRAVSTDRAAVQFGTGEEAPDPGLFSLQSAVPIPATIEDDSAIPDLPVPAGRSTRALIAAVLGLLVGAGIAIVVDRFDTRIQTREESEAVFGLPVIGEVPSLPAEFARTHRIISVTQPASFEAEAYRVLRLSAQLMSRWRLPLTMSDDVIDPLLPEQRTEVRRVGDEKVLLMTSAGPGEGKTATLANLAVSFAQAGQRVLILDCDFGGSDLHVWFKTEGFPGVADYVSDSKGIWRLADLVQPTATEGVSLVPSGSTAAHPGRMSRSSEALIAEASDLADVVLIDAGPALSSPEAALFARQADGVLLVGRVGVTRQRDARRMVQLLARVEARFLGVAIVGVPRGQMARSHRASRRSTAEDRTDTPGPVTSRP